MPDSANDANIQPGILAGLKVLDVASFIAAPTAAMVMADFGADVIKIEPPAGDFYRGVPNSPIMPDSDHNYCWTMVSRSKRSLTLDLKLPQGREVFERLIQNADVLIVNYPPKVREKLRLTYDDIAPLNERLIYASLTGYGEKGPDAELPGYDTTAYWARTGLMHYVRVPSAPPALSVPGLGDNPTGVSLFAAILLALYRRMQTGKGGMVSTSLLANGIWSNGALTQAALVGATLHPAPNREAPMNALVSIYPCKGDRWFLLNVMHEEKMWPIVLERIGRPELAKDPRFVDAAARRKHARELTQELDKAFLQHDMQTWREKFAGSGITLGVVAVMEDLLHDEQLRACGSFVPLTLPEGRVIETIDSPIWVEGSPKTPPRPAPDLGQHNREILLEHGYSDEDISTLKQAGALG
jgi:crotonobetainyl-CoA:carnitine CoA-transferase CaiB-like acyl-CoA transferase